MNRKRLITVSAVILILAGGVLFVSALFDKDYTRVALGWCFVMLGILNSVQCLSHKKNKTDEKNEPKE